MTAFTAATGGIHNFDGYTGGSVVAALDTYAISAGSTLVVRTDTNACLNHSVAFGSLDTVTFSGIGGELKFDPTYVRVIAYTGGSGNSPAFGAAISQGGVSGVFLGAWTNWQSECIVPGAAIGATGFIKIGGKTGGNFAAGALTGIAATCSGADVQGWIEVRGPDVGTITVPRIGKVSSVEAWFELGVTTGVRGQILPCPTTASFAGVWPGVWIETSAGSGVYEQYAGAGSQVALATTRTTSEMKIAWQTVAGIRIGNDGTNGVGYLPPTGCKVRIPATILTNCTRNATTGSGPRVLPNATIATRQEFITTGAGYFDLRGIVSQWYMNFSQAFYVKYKSCAIADTLVLSEIASPLDVTDCIVAPTQAQLNTPLQIVSCFGGGSVSNSTFWRFSLAASGNYCSLLSYVTGVTFTNIQIGSLTLRANGTTGAGIFTQLTSCIFDSCTIIGGRIYGATLQKCSFNNLAYYDHTITTTTSATNPMNAVELAIGCSNCSMTGFRLPIVAVGPYTSILALNACYGSVMKEIGTPSVPLALNASVTGLGLNSVGNNDGIKMKRVYISNTRVGPYGFSNSDNNVLIENVSGDYADTSVLTSLNTVAKGCALAGATSGQVSVYGTHWIDMFSSATAGAIEILCNEPTSFTTSQCQVISGTPKFNSSGSVLLTVVGQQVLWEMPYFSKGHTSLGNVAPTLTGTNTGNLTYEFQYDIGAGYNGSWLVMNAANFLAVGAINPATGIKLKVRATCSVDAAGNILTNIRIITVTSTVAQTSNLYPISTNTISLTGLSPNTDVVVLTANTTTILAQQDSNPGSTYSFTYSGAQTVDIGLIKPGFVPMYIRNLSLLESDSSIPVAQVIDRNFI